MLKKTIFLSSLLFSSVTCAEFCPTANEIQSGNFNGWKPITIENGTIPSQEMMDQFLKQVHHFVRAEWMADAPEGSGHCYYEQAIPHQNYLGVFLAKQNLRPDMRYPYWDKQNDNVMQCVGILEQCRFVDESLR